MSCDGSYHRQDTRCLGSLLGCGPMDGHPIIFCDKGVIVVDSPDNFVQVRLIFPVDNTVTNEKVDEE
jgi:hypothetical protein